jgi:hypothetical protein
VLLREGAQSNYAGAFEAVGRQIFSGQHVERQNVFKVMKRATVPSSPKVL